MTNYNPEDFKQWLEANPQKKENLNWENFFGWTTTTRERWKEFIKFSEGLAVDAQFLSYLNGFSEQKRVFLRWKEEVDGSPDFLRQEVERLKAQLAEYESPETTSDPSEPLNTKIQRKKAELSQAVTSGRRSTAPLRKEIELWEKIQNLASQINTLQAKEANYQQQIRQKEQLIQQKQSELNSLQTQLNSQTTRANNLQGQVNSLSQQISNLTAEKTALQEKMLREREEALKAFALEKNSLFSELGKLEEQKDTFQKSAGYLRETLKGTEKDLEEVKKELALSREKAQQAETEKEQALINKNEELRQRQEAFKVLQEHNANLQSKLSMASEEITKLSEWISKLEAASAEGDAFVTLQAELNHAQSEIQSLAEQLAAKSPPRNYLWLYALLALIALYFLMS